MKISEGDCVVPSNIAGNTDINLLPQGPVSLYDTLGRYYTAGFRVKF
jgi:hypothetical protein